MSAITKQISFMLLHSLITEVNLLAKADKFDEIKLRYGIEHGEAILFCKSELHFDIHVAHERYYQIPKNNGLFCLSENMQLFKKIIVDTINERLILQDCIHNGMPQDIASELFEIGTKNMRLLYSKSISKSETRVIHSATAELIIDTEMYQQRKKNRLVFDEITFCKLLLKLSRMINNLESENAASNAKLSTIIKYIVDEHDITLNRKPRIWKPVVKHEERIFLTK